MTPDQQAAFLFHQEREIRLHLNNAQSSLAAHQVKFAKSGLTSAIAAAVQAEILLTVTDLKWDEKERVKFRGFWDTALKLVDAYWEDYVVVLKDRPVAAQVVETTVKAQAKVASARHIYTEDEKLRIMLEAEAAINDNVPRWTAYRNLSKKYGVSQTTVYTWMKERA